MNRKQRRASASLQRSAGPAPQVRPPASGGDAFAVAVDHHRAGRLAEAERLYQLILASHPDHAGCLNLSGVIAAQTGKPALAAERIGKAIAIDGTVAAYHNNLGEVLRQAGRMDEAAACFRRPLGLDPDYAEAHNNLGAVLHGLGKVDQAAEHYRRALSLRPRYAEALRNLGAACRDKGDADAAIGHYRAALALGHDDPQMRADLAALQASIGAPDAPAAPRPAPQARLDQVMRCHQAGRAAEAEALCRQVLAQHPEDAAAHRLLGLICQSRGRPMEAERAYRAALARQPEDAVAHNNLGNALRDLARPDEAIEAFRTALRLRPDYAEAHYNLGVLMHRDGRLDEAAACYRQALAIRPGFSEAATNLGAALHEQGRLAEAAAAHAEAVAAAPGDARARMNHGVTLLQERRAEAAAAAFRDAVRLDPAYAAARVNLAHALLLLGDFAEGWPAYEARWQGGVDGLLPRGFRQPRWQGERLAGGTILLHAEQGLGDTLQFVRYAAPIAARSGARILLEVQKPLVRLLTGLAGVDQVLACGDALPDFDRHLPLMSAPAVLGTRLDSIPGGIPYVVPETAAVAAWGKRLARLARPRIGLAWAGSPRRHDYRLEAADRRRSIALPEWEPLLARPEASFVSLQLGGDPAIRQLPPELRPLDLTEDIADFADTAALVANLDLVISVDTSVAHLAGAMGKPVWILSRFDGCWRWLLDRDDSPWYPSARLFRQPAPGTWAPVIARLANAVSTR